MTEPGGPIYPPKDMVILGCIQSTRRSTTIISKEQCFLLTQKLCKLTNYIEGKVWQQSLDLIGVMDR